MPTLVMEHRINFGTNAFSCFCMLSFLIQMLDNVSRVWKDFILIVEIDGPFLEDKEIVDFSIIVVSVDDPIIISMKFVLVSYNYITITYNCVIASCNDVVSTLLGNIIFYLGECLISFFHDIEQLSFPVIERAVSTRSTEIVLSCVSLSSVIVWSTSLVSHVIIVSNKFTFQCK